MNKKASISSVYYWIIRVTILLPIMIFALSQIVNLSVSTSVDTYNSEFLVLENQFFSSLAPVDSSTGRKDIGIIDIKNFNQQTLNKHINAGRTFGVKLTLNDKPSIFFNKDFFDLATPLKKTNKYDFLEFKRYVLVKENNKLSPSELTFEVLFSE